MRFIYSLLMYLLAPFIVLRLWWKGRKLPSYRQRIAERFYLGKRVNAKVDVWIHAVSLGEVIAAIPLINAMLSKSWSVLVTTMTPTGSERVSTYFGDKVHHQYVPYDLPGVLKRFFRQINPKVGVIMETELWPNLLFQAHKAKVPLILANARLSESSFRGYLRLRFLFQPMLNLFNAILAQSDDDARRFIALGVKVDLVKALGNMKFDVQTNQISSVPFRQLKDLWGSDRLVVIAASTHHDEEALILQHLKRLQASIPQALLLIAPRHPERFPTVIKLCKESGFNTGVRSNPTSISKENEVIVLDSLGELLGFYGVSDYAFVGGSLVPVGGHNVLEAIAMGIPVISGKLVNNFKTIMKDLADAQAIQMIEQAKELVDVVIRLEDDVAARNQMVANASAVLEKNRGSVAKHLEVIGRWL